MKKLPPFFYENSYFSGVLFGFLFPLLSAIPVFPLMNWLKSIAWIDIDMPISKYLLMCCIPSFLVFRYYYKVLELEKTAKAMFLVTFVEVVALIILNNQSVF